MYQDKNKYYILHPGAGGNPYNEKNIKRGNRNKIIPHITFYHDKKNIIQKITKLLQFTNPVLSNEFKDDMLSLLNSVDSYEDVYRPEVFIKDLDLPKLLYEDIASSKSIYELWWYENKLSLLEDNGVIIERRNNEHHLLPKWFGGKKDWINAIPINMTIHFLFHQAHTDKPINLQIAKVLDYENKALKKNFKEQICDILIRPLDYFYDDSTIDKKWVIKKFDDRNILPLEQLMDNALSFDQSYRSCMNAYKNYSEDIIKNFQLLQN